MREKLRLAEVRPGSSDAREANLKADGLMDIQEENAGLNKMVGCLVVKTLVRSANVTVVRPAGDQDENSKPVEQEQN